MMHGDFVFVNGHSLMLLTSRHPYVTLSPKEGLEVRALQRLPRSLVAALCVMATSAAAAVFLTGTARLAAGAAFLAAFVLGGLLAGRFAGPAEPQEMARHAFYQGNYPPLPREGRVNVTVRPEGLVLRFPQHRRTEVIKHGLVVSAKVEQAGRDGQMGRVSMVLLDRITRTNYPAWLLFQTFSEAEDFLHDLATQRYAEADALWAVWRTVNLRLDVTDEDLRRGFRKTVPFTRKIACPSCGGVEGVNPSCRTCAGRGFTTERDVVEVVAPPRTPPDRKFVFEWAGNEDINGRRGPVVVRLERRQPLELEPWPERDPEHKHL